MADENERIHLDKVDARAGSRVGKTRYILPISMVLVIVIFAAILLS